MYGSSNFSMLPFYLKSPGVVGTAKWDVSHIFLEDIFLVMIGFYQGN